MEYLSDSFQVISRLIEGTTVSDAVWQTPPNINLVIGFTGDGKSTLTSALCSASLLAKKEEEQEELDDEEEVKEPDTEEEEKEEISDFKLELASPFQGITISDGASSSTVHPTLCLDQKNNLVFWDCCGFGDTRGVAQAFMNAFSLITLCSKARIKLVTVVSEDAVRTQRHRLFLKLLAQIINSFGIDVLKSSMVLVITKTKAYSSERKLRTKLAKISKTTDSQMCKSILQMLANNVIPACCFPMPKAEGPYHVDNTIIEALKSREYAKVQHHIDFSCFLEGEEKNQLSLLYKRSFTEFQNQLASLLTKWLEEYYKKPEKHHKSLISCAQLLGNQLNIQDKFNILWVSIGIQDPNFQKLADSFKVFKSLLKEITCPLDIVPRIIGIEDIDQNTLSIRATVLGMSEVNRRIAHYGKNFQQINVICSHSFFVDDNLAYPSGIFVLITNTLEIVGNRLIDLSGRLGPAWQKKEIEGPLNGCLDGQDGRPGRPGENGGQIFLKAKEGIQLSSLTINVSGGKGGNGQNGGNGAFGIDGENAATDSVDARRKSSLVLRKKFTCQEIRDYLDKTIKFLFTFNDKFVEVYQTRGINGGKGGKAGKGGHGGVGGLPGSIELDIQKGDLPKFLISHGPEGMKGDPGQPGRGGQNGKHYQGIYINEYFCPGIRGIKETRESAPTIIPNFTGTSIAAGIGVVSAAAETVVMEGVQVIIKNGIPSVVNSGGQVLAQQGINGVIKIGAIEGGKVVVKGVSTIASIGALATMIGLPLVASLYSALSSSEWKNDPCFVDPETPYGPSGDVPTDTNSDGKESPKPQGTIESVIQDLRNKFPDVIIQ